MIEQSFEWECGDQSMTQGTSLISHMNIMIHACTLRICPFTMHNNTAYTCMHNALILYVSVQLASTQYLKFYSMCLSFALRRKEAVATERI